MEFKFPENSQVYTFTLSTSLFGPCRDRLADMSPQGDTPMYDALFNLLDAVPNGKNITVLTDGEDTSIDKKQEHVIKKAKEKRIRISVIGVGIKDNYIEIMKTFAKSTGGGFYAFN